jgi:nitrate reductase gamma subunit
MIKNALNFYFYFYLMNDLFVNIFRVMLNISGVLMTLANESKKTKNFDFTSKRLNYTSATEALAQEALAQEALVGIFTVFVNCDSLHLLYFLFPQLQCI